VFLAAARAGRFSRAAGALGLQQSTVSRRIAALEATVGGELFLRSHAGLVPTARGAALLAAVPDLEVAAARALRAAAGADEGVVGEVRLAVAPGLASFWLAPRLPWLLDAHPGLRVELVVSTSAADLTRREADLALRFVRPTGEDLVARKLGELAHGVLCHPRWAAAAWSDLPWVLVTVPGLTTPEEAWTAEHAARPPALRTTDYDAAVAAVRAGVGAMIGSAALAVDGMILREPPAPLPAPVPLWLVGHRATRHTARVDAAWRALATWAEEDLRTRQPAAEGAPADEPARRHGGGSWPNIQS
jgi:DNA-binding transcriptional LysR family regulator